MAQPDPKANTAAKGLVSRKGLPAAARHFLRLLEVASLIALVVALGYGFRAPLGEMLGAGASTIDREIEKGLSRLDAGRGSSAGAAPAPRLASVVNTVGIGFASRSGCSDEARLTDDGIPEGAQVRVIEAGAATCNGWTYVEWQGRRTWVRDSYLALSSR